MAKKKGFRDCDCDEVLVALLFLEKATNDISKAVEDKNTAAQIIEEQNLVSERHFPSFGSYVQETIDLMKNIANISQCKPFDYAEKCRRLAKKNVGGISRDEADNLCFGLRGLIV